MSKFSGKSDKGENYQLSLFKGTDNLTSAFNTTKGRFKISGTEDEINKQIKRIESEENTELLQVIELYYDKTS